MQTNPNSMWWARGATFALSALVATSAIYWGLKAGTVAPPTLNIAVAEPGDPVDSLAVARALGGGLAPASSDAPAPVASSRFVLAGVVADRGKGGAALISVDGKPAKPFRVGAAVDGGLVLKSVTGRRASLAASLNAPEQVTLEMPTAAK